MSPRIYRRAALLVAVSTWGCHSPSSNPVEGVRATPVYDPGTGRLEQLVSDRNGDGRSDMRAFMKGSRVERIELDRDGNGRVDRREYYGAAGPTAGSEGVPATIERAEETNGPNERITRRESYEHGALRLVEEDTDVDGRVDKWERYEAGLLVRVELDLLGTGFANRRLTYHRDGSIAAVEEDATGRGTWRALTAPAQ